MSNTKLIMREQVLQLPHGPVETPVFMPVATAVLGLFVALTR